MLVAGSASAQNPHSVDLAEFTPQLWGFMRATGSTGDGSKGLPVAGGLDADGDGFADVAFGSFRASPFGRTQAGEIYLIFGDGTGKGAVDTAAVQAGILRFVGDVDKETAGSEVWMDDVTGDGLADLLIARQNYTPSPTRIGAGALTIIVGGSALRSFANTLQTVDLRSPPAALTVATLVGADELDRFGIWMRTGDVTGDGTADLVIGADAVSELSETHRGAIYVVRGGPHLAASQTIDLIDFGTTALPGDVARITPPTGASHYHFGGTVQIADLDGNGRAEVLAAATLNRAGASIAPSGAPAVHASGGAIDGTLYIAWDDNFTDPWPNGFSFEITSGAGSHTEINGANCNLHFGEEMLGGLDYDSNGAADLFVGDIIGDCGPTSRSQAGSGHVFFNASALKNLTFDLQSPPMGLVTTDIFGAAAGDLASDTALHGDFDGDARADLAVTSPHADLLGRNDAGALHVLFGRTGGWPASIDLAALPSEAQVRITEVVGAKGSAAGDAGDTLGYSAAAGDFDGDGHPDLITNEMVGNGVLPAAVDVGNLIVLSGRRTVEGPGVPALGAGSGALLAALLACLGGRATRRSTSP